MISVKRRARFAGAVAAVVVTAGCAPGTAATPAAGGRIRIVAAENQYGDVAAQIGGQYVDVTSIVSNPNTDPHTYEVSASVARSIASASIVIQNGLGYDSFMNTVESAIGGGGRRVFDVRRLLGVPAGEQNPHLWYDPKTMPAVASALAAELRALQPAHAAYFAANLARFSASLQPWLTALATFRDLHPGAMVATTEPVADYMLPAAGATDRTPLSFEADVMNGIDPAPQAVSIEDQLLRHHQVKVLVYNHQVTDSVTQGLLSLARRAGVPVVGVYETMPAPGYDYQSWMLAEVEALDRAVTSGTSTEGL